MDAYEFIKKAIILGDYSPGERLTEQNLAKELQISRTPIREAIKRLESERLITPLKRGVIVRKFSKEDIKQIYDLRALLEGYAAAEAASRRNKIHLKRMKVANEDFKEIILNKNDKDIDQIKMIMDVNSSFHKAVLDASQNEHLHFHITNVTVLPLMFRSFYWYNDRQIQHSYELHETIRKAILNQDHERARTAMLEHIYQGRDHVLKLTEENDLYNKTEEGKL
ncbi:GntR family transcriptional regulator [Evansella sp. LMS18]|uniref:GntR family transcriptional regulator n=1 Tax=Evansella sp. LMS18 TaxID=2924033 RepID=UPI0020D164F0|nr:GntR family transcriptional regulator [Evansella sp. LMS18]UTR10255.1 GntR family transcriptional regulator [Evansella sp. LMS18]